MNHALVTGSAGFIGSHLVEHLLTQGYEVTGVDCFTELYDRKQKAGNQKILSGHPQAKNFHFLEDDLLQADLHKILAGKDFIFHLAGEPGVRKSWGDDFSIYLERNVLLTQKLLEASRKFSPKKFVFASSSSVYGNRQGEKCQEKDLCRPFSPYGVTKLAAENLCMLYHDNYQIPAVALRYFTVFGPRQRPDMAFHRFIANALRGKPLVVYGDGKQSRDFTYVSDAVMATEAAAQKGKPGQIYNIGGGCPASVEEVIAILRRELKPRALNITHEAEIHGDVRHTRCEITQAKKDLSYIPQVSLGDGLAREVSWFLEMSA